MSAAQEDAALAHSRHPLPRQASQGALDMYTLRTRDLNIFSPLINFPPPPAPPAPPAPPPSPPPGLRRRTRSPPLSSLR